MYRHGLKRIIDLILASIALFIIGPILLVITIWLHFANLHNSCAGVRGVK